MRSQSSGELATSLAIMHATLESTTDAILVTDEANYVRHFNEKYINLWGIPSAKYLTVEMPLRFPTDLYLFSDGVFETLRHQDTKPLNHLLEFLVEARNGQGRTVAEIRDRTLKHPHGTPPPDDCSVLKVSVS